MAAISPGLDNKLLNSDIANDCGYKSDFGAKNPAARKPSMILKKSKGAMSARAADEDSNLYEPKASKKNLPEIDHSKVMEKLRRITGKSQDFAMTDASSV